MHRLCWKYAHTKDREQKKEEKRKMVLKHIQKTDSTCDFHHGWLLVYLSNNLIGGCNILTLKSKATKKQQQAMERLLKRYHKTGKPILPLMKLEQPDPYGSDRLDEGKPEAARETAPVKAFKYFQWRY
jgi:hypothetical protein